MDKTKKHTLIREFLFNHRNSLIIEAALTPQQLEKANEYFKNITRDKHTLVNRYGKDAEKVAYGRAIKMAKKSTTEMNRQKLKELVRKSLMDNTVEEIIDSKSYIADREPIEVGHRDDEPHMIKAELYQIGKYAMELYAILEEYSEMDEQVGFPAWWQEKITTAKIMMSEAKHYLEFEVNEPMVDKAIDMVTGEKPHIGEPKSHMRDQDEIEEGLPKGFWAKKIPGGMNESYKTLVNKIEKQGKSSKASKAIAGAVASYKLKGGGKGPTAKQKAR